FQRAGLDALLLEVGLGGRLDAVNIVEPDIAIITTVALDHMDWLGDDRESIGREKAGIFRYKKPAICGDFAPPASVLEVARKLKCPLYCMERDFFPPRLTDLPTLHLLLQNAATALMAVECLQPRLPVDTLAIKQGLSTARAPGRFQQFSTPANIILDVA